MLFGFLSGHITVIGGRPTGAVFCIISEIIIQESLALASMARDDPPASTTASSTAPASSTAAAMRGKVGSEFET